MTDDRIKNLSQLVKVALKGKSQVQLAKAAGVKRQRIASWLAGTLKKLNVEKCASPLNKIMTPFNLSIGDLDLRTEEFTEKLKRTHPYLDPLLSQLVTLFPTAADRSADIRLVGEYTVYSLLLGSPSTYVVCNYTFLRPANESSCLRYKARFIASPSGAEEPREIEANGVVVIASDRAFLFGAYNPDFRTDPLALVLTVGAARAAAANSIHGIVLGMEDKAPNRICSARVSCYRKGYENGRYDHEIGIFPKHAILREVRDRLSASGAPGHIISWSNN